MGNRGIDAVFLQLAVALAALLCTTANPYVTNTLCNKLKNSYAFNSAQLLQDIGIKPNVMGKICPEGLKQAFERLKNTKLGVEFVFIYTVCCDSKAPKIHYIEFQGRAIYDKDSPEINDPVTIIATNRMEFDHPESNQNTRLSKLPEKWGLELHNHKFNLCFYANKGPELTSNDIACKP